MGRRNVPRHDSSKDGKTRVRLIEAARKAARAVDATACNRMQPHTVDDAKRARIAELLPDISERDLDVALAMFEAMARTPVNENDRV
jgi:hypothetical protein